MSMKLEELQRERSYDAKHQHYFYDRRDADVDVEECYQDFWKELLTEEPSLEIKRELYDFHGLMKDLPLLFEEITGGAISKPNTAISAVLDEYQEHLNAEIEAAIIEHDEAEHS